MLVFARIFEFKILYRVFMQPDRLALGLNNNQVVSSSNESQALLEDQVPRRRCFTDWIGRVVTHCPGGYYTNSTSLKVRSVLIMTGVISIGTLMIGGIWIDSLDDTQKIIISSTGVIGTFGSMIGYTVDSYIYRNQPSNR